MEEITTRTLKLNNASIPIEVIDWKDAMSLCYGLETAIPIVEYKDKVIRTPNNSYLIPSVIQLISSFYQPKIYVKELPFTRQNVYLRDGGKCMYCNNDVGLSSFTLDHIIPQKLGGETNWMNVVVSCMKCNGKKDCHPLEKCGLNLIRKPYIPKLDKAAPASIVNEICKDIPEESWKDYIYWNVIFKNG